MTNPSSVQRRSVQATGPGTALELMGDGLVLSLASVADSFTPWGLAPKQRDRELRAFWPTEPVLASALYSIAIRNAAFSWTIEGPERTVAAVQDMLQTADFGKGWRHFITKIGTDLFTQDNGAFMEVIRAADSPTAPVVGIAHLDAMRCTRTADPDFPVNYVDRKGVIHRMAWYQIQALSEFPSPVETMFGTQLCAVSRVLRAAQVLRDIGIFQREKIAGDNPNAIYIVGGVSSKMMSDAMEQHKTKQAERGMTRYIIPLVIASMDPTATVSVESIDLKSLPDGFDIEEAMRWYINQLALGFGADYQDFAPLPGRNLGSSTQSMVLHEKSRGRGPATFMSMMSQVFNFQGILPANVLFRYDEQDVAADMEQADLEKTTAETLDLYVQNATLTPAAARQVMLDKGMLSPEIFESLQEGPDLTTNVVAQEDEPVDAATPSGHTGGIQTAARHDDDDDENPKKPRPRRRRRYNSKAEGDLPPMFAEDERLALEETMEDEMAAVLDRAFRKARGIMGLPPVSAAAKARALLGNKQEPPDIFDDDAFWTTFQADAVTTMLPLARQGALQAAQVNLDLGVAVNMDLVNAEVLSFSERYATAWWDEIEVASQNSLRRAVTTWQEGGLGRRGLPDLVKAIEPTFGKARAERIAVTEVTQIFDEGNRLAHNSGGIEEEEWQTVEDAAVDSEICRPLNGRRFPTNEGPRPVKDTHIGCRCARLGVGDNDRVVGGA